LAETWQDLQEDWRLLIKVRRLVEIPGRRPPYRSYRCGESSVNKYIAKYATSIRGEKTLAAAAHVNLLLDLQLGGAQQRSSCRRLLIASIARCDHRDLGTIKKTTEFA
jgi:hypothetical protein